MDKEVSIQPYYLKDNRKSEHLERNAIETISKEIQKHPRTKCNILDLVTMNVSDIQEDKEITGAYNNILKTDLFGSQYDWLARFAKHVENLELTIHQDDKAFIVIKKHGNVTEKNDDISGRYYVLNKEKSPKDLITVFGNYHFPVLDTSKLEMKKWAESKGLISIMNKTWFCYRPKNNKPCGACNPCRYTIEEGLLYRFSLRALLNHKIKKFRKQSAIYGFAKKVYYTWK